MTFIVYLPFPDGTKLRTVVFVPLTDGPNWERVKAADLEWYIEYSFGRELQLKNHKNEQIKTNTFILTNVFDYIS